MHAKLDNALAGARARSANAEVATRQEFVRALRKELPEALSVMMKENIAPVDLAQATIGPGMSIYSRVLESDGSAMGVRRALQLINAELDSALAEAEGEMDESRFCIAWFEQYGNNDGKFGEADVLARARNTSVSGLERAGVLSQRSGTVRLLKREELSEDWEPGRDDRAPVWECTQQLVKALMTGDAAAADLVKKFGAERAEEARSLSYRLYTLCERKRWAEEGSAYNSLVIAWPQIQELASRDAESSTLFDL